MSDTIQTEVVVIGSGPGGYAAAFRAADLGLKVTLIERYSSLGGVCLNVGCIPSKALLHVSQVLTETEEMADIGVSYKKPEINLDKLKGWKDGIVSKLTGGLKMLAKQRKVNVVEGYAQFIDNKTLSVQAGDTEKKVAFQYCVIAAGSEPVSLPFIPEDPRIITSTGALKLEDPACKLLVLGGGIIGLEMATVYQALGADVTVVEMQNQIIPGADSDLVAPLRKRMAASGVKFLMETKVTAVDAKDDGLWVSFDGKQAPEKAECFDRMLVAVGRRPNGDKLAAEKAGITLDRAFIPVDNQLRTNVSHIFAIGDVIGQPMLAHKAAAEGRLAAEVIAGKKHVFEPACIPSVAYTNPEVAWVGLTEVEAKAQGIEIEKGVFPWAASGRALALNRTEGSTKIIVDATSKRVLGAGIVGVNAGELIGELALAIEMGCDIEDVALTIHAHPTLHESVMLAAEACEGTITDLYMPKKKKTKTQA